MTTQRNESNRQELLSSRLAAGALVVLSLALATVARAEPVTRIARVTPIHSPRSAVQPEERLQTAAASPVAPTASAGNVALEQLGMGDMVRITVFRNPDLTTEARISERGTVLFPMIGEVQLSGLTPSQAGRRIADKLTQGRYVVNPEVTVSMMQVNSRQVSVLGNVNKPGRYPLDSQTAHLTDFIAVAGGLAPTGSDVVTVVSTKDGRTSKREVDLAEIFDRGDVSQNVELQPGDTVYVHKAPMVYVYGEVQKGGAYRVEPNMTVMQAIAMGGGVTPRGTLRGVKISRRDGTNVREISARLTDTVKPDDVVYVAESLF
ncbi:MAG TPA: polysaccharide export protein EpsE [Usitatibacter sp.]|nr:polysaccharide export protein EpsE [Usitatibacter sp.]